jgi:basic amino acid/polyamine antiporter, APA family
VAPVIAAGLAMVGVLWAYEGWQWVTFSAGETENPQRTFPRGIVLGTLLLATIYVLANAGYIAALGPEGAAASRNPAADAVRATLGAGAAKVVVAMVLVAIVSASLTIPLTMPRVFFAMGRDGVFFRKLGEVHPRFGTPAFAIVAGSLWAVVLTLTGTFTTLLSYVVFVGWIFYALGAASIFVFRRRAPDAPRPYRVPLYPLTPILFVLTSSAIVINTLVGQTRTALIGLAIVATGIPVFFVWRTRTAKELTADG